MRLGCRNMRQSLCLLAAAGGVFWAQAGGVSGCCRFGALGAGCIDGCLPRKDQRSGALQRQGGCSETTAEEQAGRVVHQFVQGAKLSVCAQVVLEGLDHVLMATGRKPNTRNLGLEEVGRVWLF